MLTFSAQAVQAQAKALAALLAGGRLHVYGGAMPAEADAPVRDQPLLAEVQLAAAPVPAPGGEFQLVATQALVTPKQAGKPTWFRCLTADGKTVLQGTAGTADADLLVERAELLPGHEIALTGFRYRQPKAGPPLGETSPQAAGRG